MSVQDVKDSKFKTLFNAESLSKAYAQLDSPEERMAYAYKWLREESSQNALPQNLVLSSSFGPQSILMLHFMKKANLDIPVVSVDIKGAKYDVQREYREHLRKELGFDLYLAHAHDDSEKDKAMIKALKTLNAGGVLSGLRSVQTENRSKKPYAEWRDKNNAYSLHPILKWPDQGVHSFLTHNIDENLWHPNYQEGVQAIGGAIIGKGEKKEECGLHIDGGGI